MKVGFTKVKNSVSAGIYRLEPAAGAELKPRDEVKPRLLSLHLFICKGQLCTEYSNFNVNFVWKKVTWVNRRVRLADSIITKQ